VVIIAIWQTPGEEPTQDFGKNRRLRSRALRTQHLIECFQYEP
jgi:hypothetical protein